MRGIDEYMRGSGRVLRAGFTKVWGPGRHMAGDNTFTYFLDPHGNTVESTTELECLDEDTLHPHVYDFSQPEVTDQWGTANAMNEIVAMESCNDPDRGVFVVRRSDPSPPRGRVRANPQESARAAPRNHLARSRPCASPPTPTDTTRRSRWWRTTPSTRCPESAPHRDHRPRRGT